MKKTKLTKKYTKEAKDGEERFEEQFGTSEQILEAINSKTVPTKESLERRDSLLRLYEDMKTFISKEIEQARQEERKKIWDELRELPVVLVDTKFNPDDKPKIEHAVLWKQVKSKLSSDK